MASNNNLTFTGAPAAAAPNLEEVEAFKNLKTETMRKLANTEAKIDELTRVNQLLAQQLTQATQARMKPAEPEFDDKKLADLALDNPAAYVKVVEEKAKRAAQTLIDQDRAAQGRQNQIFGDIMAEFPEAANASHELVKRAGELHATLAMDERADPRTYKQVVYQAAAELGIKPKSKRPVSDDDSFTLGSKGSSKGKGEPQLSDITLQFAKAMGRPVDKPEYVETLKKFLRG